MIRLANRFSEEFDVHLIVVKGGGVLEERVSSTVTVHDLQCARVKNAFTLIRRLLKELEPKWVFASIIRLNFLMALIKLSMFGRFKLVIRQPAMPGNCLEDVKYKTLNRIAYKLLYPVADHIICQSKDMQEDMTTVLGLNKYRLLQIYNPRNEQYNLDLVETVLSPYPQSGLNFLSIGRFEHQKGYDLLIPAFTQFCKTVPGAHLTILGEGHLRGELESAIKEHGMEDRITLPGFVKEPMPYLYHARALVLSSRYEGLSNVAIESISLGTPVVATRCPGGMSEIVQNGVNGYLSEQITAEGIYSALKQFVETPLNSDRRGIAATAGKFDPETVYRSYLQLFR